jgi:hypothetical protein
MGINLLPYKCKCLLNYGTDFFVFLPLWLLVSQGYFIQEKIGCVSMKSELCGILICSSSSQYFPATIRNNNDKLQGSLSATRWWRVSLKLSLCTHMSHMWCQYTGGWGRKFRVNSGDIRRPCLKSKPSTKQPRQNTLYKLDAFLIQC